MKRLLYIFIIALLSTSLHAQEEQFPYPTIPSTLTTPQERGPYLIEHYWDNYAFADTVLIDHKEISEQGFANFIDLLPRFDSIAAQTGIDRFCQRAFGRETPSKVADAFDSMMEHYLSDPNSPMRNEELYIMFLQSQVSTLRLSGSDALRPQARLTTALKNRLGTRASDFRYTTRTGQQSSLYETKAPLLLLVFYDPACDHCREIIKMLIADANLKAKIAEGTISVLAVYTEGDRLLWNASHDELPAEWTVAIDESDIVQKGTYDLPAMPVLYLLDQDKTVLLKDPNVNVLLGGL